MILFFLLILNSLLEKIYMKSSKNKNLPVQDFLKYEEFIIPEKEKLPDLISSIKKEKSLAIFCSENISIPDFITPFIDVKNSDIELLQQSYNENFKKIVIIGSLFTAQMVSLFNPDKKIIFFQLFEKTSLEDLYRCLHFEFEEIKISQSIKENLTHQLKLNHG